MNNITFFAMGYVFACFLITIIQEFNKYKNKEN